MKNLIRVFSLFVVGIVILAGYQNCSRPEAANSQNSHDSSSVLRSGVGGNGSVYDGKLYVNKIVDGLCEDGSAIRSEIKVQGEASFVTRENCKTIPPKVVTTSSLQLMEHNLSNLIHESRVFDEKAQVTETTSYLCRSHYKQRFTEGEFRIIGDFSLLMSGTQADTYSGRYRFGYYDYAYKMREPSFDSGPLVLRQTSEVIDDHFHFIFNSSFVKDGKTFNTYLRLRRDNLEGWLEIKPEGAGASTQQSIQDPPNFGFRVLCYQQ